MRLVVGDDIGPGPIGQWIFDKPPCTTIL